MRFNCNIEISEKEKQGYIEFIHNKEHNNDSRRHRCYWH